MAQILNKPELKLYLNPNFIFKGRERRPLSMSLDSNSQNYEDFEEELNLLEDYSVFDGETTNRHFDAEDLGHFARQVEGVSSVMSRSDSVGSAHRRSSTFRETQPQFIKR